MDAPGRLSTSLSANTFHSDTMCATNCNLTRAGRYQICFAYRDTLPTYHDIVTKITNGHSKRKAHTAPNKWKQRVQFSYVNAYSGQYLSNLSNAYRHAYLARSVIQPVEEEGWKTKWKNSLPGTIFRLHACGTDADCACIRVNYGQLALPRRRAGCRNIRLVTIY